MRIGPVVPTRSGRLVLAITLVLAACSAEPDSHGAVSAEQDRQLNDAAAALDANAAVDPSDDSDNQETSR